jgi:hypothetical protein
VALPVVSTGRGGHRDETGLVVRRLLELLQAATDRYGFVTVLVCYDEPTHYAAQVARLLTDRARIPVFGGQSVVVPDETLDSAAARRVALGEAGAEGDVMRRHLFPALSDELWAEVTRLARLGGEGRLALFFESWVAARDTRGSLWIDLARRALKADEAELRQLAALPSHEQASYVQRRLGGPEPLMREVLSELKPTVEVPLLHWQLSALGCVAAVTPSLDDAYAHCVRSSVGSGRLYVLPNRPADSRCQWLLQLNGGLELPGEMVLTREDAMHADALRPLQGSVVSSLLLTCHVLVVGADDTIDPVLQGAMHSVAKMLHRGGDLGEGDAKREAAARPVCTVLLLDENRVLADTCAPLARCVPLTRPAAAAEAAEQQQQQRAAAPRAVARRRLEVMLDAVVALQTVASARSRMHVMDRRFEHVLTQPQRELKAFLAARLRALPAEARCSESFEHLEALMARLGMDMSEFQQRLRLEREARPLPAP